MSIKTQKNIKYIPIVNFVVIMFCWIKAYAKYSTSVWRVFKPILKVFFVMIIVNIPRFVIEETAISSLSYWVLYYGSLFVMLFVISCILIKDQEKLIQERERDN